MCFEFHDLRNFLSNLLFRQQITCKRTEWLPRLPGVKDEVVNHLAESGHIRVDLCTAQEFVILRHHN